MDPNRGALFDEGATAVSVVQVVRFLRRQALLILATALVGALAIAVVVVFVLPDRFEASTTLVVVPLTFKSELMPSILPVQGYQRLLESDGIIGETTQRLIADGAIAPGRRLRIGRDLTSRIFVSRRAEERTLAPIIEAVAFASSAEQAAAIANGWAAVFLENAKRLSKSSLSPTLALIESEFKRERANLESLEQQRAEVANEYSERVDLLAQSWDRKRVEAEKATEDKLTQYHKETRLAMEQVVQEVASGEPSVAESVLAPDTPLGHRLSQLMVLRTQLAQTPRFHVLETAINEDTLWQAFALHQAQKLDLQSALGRTLLSQEVNVVHDELTLRLSQLETDLEEISPAERQWVRRASAGLEDLQRARAAELAKLLSDRALVASDLKRQGAREIAVLRREQANALGQLERDVRHKQVLFDKLASNFNEVILARAEQGGQDILRAASAVAPGKPQKQLLVKLLVGAFLGGLLGLFLGVVREIGGS